MLRKIYFWECVVGDSSLFEKHREKILLLLNGRTKEADLDLKKLAGHRLYSIRLNKSDRLLFTTQTINGRNCLVVLEAIYNHDYQKSRFLKPGVLDHFLEANTERFTTQVSDASFRDFAELTLSEEPASAGLEFAPLDFYNQTFIELNIPQRDAVKSALPLVVSGPPGSGKSCVALKILKQCAESAIVNEAPVLYVTQSQRLVDYLQAQWRQMPVANQERVIFRTYKQLLIECENVIDLNEADENKVAELIQKFIALQKAIQKAKSIVLPANVLAKEADVLQEFRILSALDNKQQYFELGERQALFSDEKSRELAWQAFQYCQVQLKAQKLYHPAFLKGLSKAKFARIVVDEAQDLSHGQLRWLAELAEYQQICYCMDSHQSLADNKSKRPFLLDLLQKMTHRSQEPIDLPYSYRCPANIAAVGNGIISAKNHLTGGIADKYEKSEILSAPNHEAQLGSVHWVDPLNLKQEDKGFAERLAQSEQIAIVTLSEHLAEARATFKTVLIFTPDQIKGLEYPTIVAYRLFDAPLCVEANPLLASCNTGVLIKNRAKKAEAEERFGPYFNQVLVACTRAMRTLIIYQAKRHELSHLIRVLSEAAQPQGITAKDASRLCTTTNWEQEFKRQVEQGNLEHAQDIFIRHLNGTPAEFNKKVRDSEHKSASVVMRSIPAAALVPTYTVATEQKEKVQPEKQEKKVPTAAQLKKKSKPAAVNQAQSKTLNQRTAEEMRLDQYLEASLRIDIKLIKKILSDPQGIRLFFVVKTKEGVTFYESLRSELEIGSQIAKGPSIISEFTAERLNSPIEMAEKKLITPLGELCRLPIGQIILSRLNKKNFKNLDLKILISPEVFGRPIDCLAQNQDGRAFISNLIQHTHFAQILPPEYFFTGTVLDPMTGENPSLFERLVVDPTQSATLKLFFKVENIMQRLSFNNLLNRLILPTFHLLDQGGGCERAPNKKAIFYLVKNHMDLLKQILTKRKDIAREIRACDLLLQSDQAGSDCPFMTLLIIEVKMGILEHLITLNQDFFTGITLDKIINESTDLLACLIMTKGGIFLQMMLKENPNLRERFVDLIFNQDTLAQINFDKELIPVIVALFYTKILELMIEESPEFINRFQFAYLWKSFRGMGGAKHNLFTFCLAEEKNSAVLLKLITKKQELAAHFTATHLFDSSGFISKGGEYVSKLFLTIMTFNPNIATQPETVKINEINSEGNANFHILAANEHGRNMLRILIEKNERFCATISLELITRKTRYISQPSLNTLAECSDGQLILALLIKHPATPKNVKEAISVYVKKEESALIAGSLFNNKESTNAEKVASIKLGSAGGSST